MWMQFAASSARRTVPFAVAPTGRHEGSREIVPRMGRRAKSGSSPRGKIRNKLRCIGIFASGSADRVTTANVLNFQFPRRRKRFPGSLILPILTPTIGRAGCASSWQPPAAPPADLHPFPSVSDPLDASSHVRHLRPAYPGSRGKCAWRPRSAIELLRLSLSGITGPSCILSVRSSPFAFLPGQFCAPPAQGTI